MKKIITVLIILPFSILTFGQSKCIYSDSAKVYFKDGKICNLNEHFYDSLTNTIIYNKYVNGLLVSFNEYDTLMNKIQEFYSTNNLFISSDWDNKGTLRNHLIKQDTASYKFSWDENGVLKKYEEMKDSNFYSFEYYPNGKTNSLFTCNYKKDSDCVLKTYDKNGKIWFLYIWRPLNFVKIDSLKRTKLPLQDLNKNLFSVGPNKVFRSNGSLEEEIFFKYGIVNKVVEYGVDGSEIITLYDDNGNAIEKK